MPRDPQEQDPEFTQGGAPGGRYFSDSELPVVAVPGGPPASTGGFSPDNSQPPLPSPESNEPAQKPPGGIRR